MHLIERTKEGYRIVRDSSRESGKAFYARVGHLFVDKEIRKEMGGPLDSNDDYIWLLVMDEGDVIIAFACLNTERLENKGEVWFDNAYVFPAYRQHGLHARLFDLRMQIVKILSGVRCLKGLARPVARMAFEARGFDVLSERGQYRVYQKVYNDDDL